ncbi:unnamed protein product [Allacma fusca]|uniref:Uncharacterized protein n=1 Tax=Allacma fusca TaxID=39272 RepID=A0A8J2K8X3_9HEXA|nr:unnamed protein product [Allacma fusca]
MVRAEDPAVILSNNNNNYLLNPGSIHNQHLVCQIHQTHNQTQAQGRQTPPVNQSILSNQSSDSIDFNGSFTKPSPNGSSTSCFCRICHDGDTSEALVAPCRCTGTVALIHTSCLEHWLTTSNSDKCEICNFSYKISKEPRPCSEYLNDTANQFNVRNLIADIICFFLLTPLLVVSTYLCFLGAKQYFLRERWEAVGLLILSIFLLAVYITWCHVTTRFHISVWKSWQRTNQQIRLTEVHQPHCRESRGRRLPSPPGSVNAPVLQNIPQPPSQTRRVPFSIPAHQLITLDEENLDVSDTSRILIV